MGAKILLLACGVIAFSSCSVYKSGQTPDDVYYSPAPEVNEYVRVDNSQDERHRTYDEYSEDYRNDRFMRLSMGTASRWNTFDDYYWNNNLLYNNYYGYNSWNNPWNSYYYWNSFYNPYCSGNIIYVNPSKYPTGTAAISRPQSFNYNGYVNPSYNNNNLYFNNGGNQNSRISSRYNNSFNTQNSSNSTGSSLRRLFNGSNNNNNGSYNTYDNHRNSNGLSNSNNNYSQPSSRSYTPSSGGSSGGSSSGSSGGGGSISRPSRN